MNVLLQISDPHFGTERPQILQALCELVRQQQPGVLVLSGDITQRARRVQFDAAQRFVRELAIPQVLALPGNHDIPLFNLWRRLFDPYAGFRRAFGHQLEPVLDTPDLLAIAVKTTRRRRHCDGEVSPAQVERVASRLRQAQPRQLRVVVTHQPVDVPRAQDEHDLLHGHAEAAQTWVEAGADLLMGGHIHLPFVRPLQQRFAALKRRAWCVQAGTAVSARVRAEAPNSVNLLRYAGGLPPRCVVERWDHTVATGHFECVQRDDLAVQRS